MVKLLIADMLTSLKISPLLPLKTGQEVSGGSSTGNPGQRIQRGGRETKSSPGGGRWNCGVGVDLVCNNFATHALHLSVCLFFFLYD